MGLSDLHTTEKWILSDMQMTETLVDMQGHRSTATIMFELQWIASISMFSIQSLEGVH